MNILTESTNSTLRAFQYQSKIGLWAGAVPPTLQQPVVKNQCNTSTAFALTLAAMFGSVGLAPRELPPTFADTALITASPSILERGSSVLFDYEISQSQVAVVNEYLHQHITSRDFLRDIAVIIDDIYGSKVIRDVHVVKDVDTGKPIMELTILSGLPLNDEFDQKDQLLFQMIEASGLAWGLRDVVISQG